MVILWIFLLFECWTDFICQCENNGDIDNIINITTDLSKILLLVLIP